MILSTRHVGSRPLRPATDPSVPALSLPGPAPLPADSWARQGACQGQGPGLGGLCPGAQHRVCPLEELCKRLPGSDGHAGQGCWPRTAGDSSPRSSAERPASGQSRGPGPAEVGLPSWEELGRGAGRSGHTAPPSPTLAPFSLPFLSSLCPSFSLPPDPQR